VFTGMGGSYHTCYAPVTSLAQAGRPAWMADAAELMHFRLPALGEDSLLIVVSQSGASAETVGLVERVRAMARARPRILAVTNGTDNALASQADLVFDTRAGDEGGVSTKTFVATLVVLRLVADVLVGLDPSSALDRTARDTDRAAAAGDALLRHPPDLGAHMIEWLGGRPSLAVLGRGWGRSASEMGALTLKEAARVPAEAVETGQFRHGPLELAGPGFAAIVVATDPITRRLDLRLASDIANTGAAAIVIGSASAAPTIRTVPLPELHPGLAPAVAIVPVQALAWRLSLLRGGTPGTFAHTSKVTTRE
jgi:glutamine---fructose-6-phosphate transaminase (isomerizing)